MAALSSPFSCGDQVKKTDALVQGQKFIVRVEKVDSVQVNIKKDGTPSATAADYFLTGGDALEILGPPGVVLGFLNVAGDPDIYITTEPV